jgi:hypothetical protein
MSRNIYSFEPYHMKLRGILHAKDPVYPAIGKRKNVVAPQGFGWYVDC